MKSPYVKELAPNQLLNTYFLVQNKEIRQKKSGEPYLSLALCDRTGELDAKMWDNVAEVMETFERDDFVKVKGLIQIFHNRPQLTIHKIRRAGDSEVELADYFPASERDQDEMLAQLRGIIAGVKNPHLRGLLDALLNDPEIARRYKTAPAAKQIHHAYLGGLIEHVLSLCGMAALAASHYRMIDLDLLLTGVVLHDMGKIHELTYERGFGYSTEGQLLGHISIAMRMVGDKLAGLPDFPPRLRSLVEHMILSHHGRLEFGSPGLPQTRALNRVHGTARNGTHKPAASLAPLRGSPKASCSRASTNADCIIECAVTAANSVRARNGKLIAGRVRPSAHPVSPITTSTIGFSIPNLSLGPR